MKCSEQGTKTVSQYCIINKYNQTEHFHLLTKFALFTFHSIDLILLLLLSIFILRNLMKWCHFIITQIEPFLNQTQSSFPWNLNNVRKKYSKFSENSIHFPYSLNQTIKKYISRLNVVNTWMFKGKFIFN